MSGFSGFPLTRWIGEREMKLVEALMMKILML